MEKKFVKIKPLSHFKGELPQYQSPGASGFDLRAQLDSPLLLQPGERALIPTGLCFEVPFGYELQARPRSGWALKHGLTLLNTPGTIDSDYRGEVQILVVNLGKDPFTIEDQERCAQMVLCPVYQAHWVLSESLGGTLRGDGGFGSTGKS